MTTLRSKMFDEISVGDEAVLERTLTQRDILAFAGVSGDINPAHLDDGFAAGTVFREVIGHGMWTGALVSALLGTKLPGPGTIYKSQSFNFLAPVKVGDTLRVTVKVTGKSDDGRTVHLSCWVTNQDGKKVLSGEADVIAPREPIEVAEPEVPALILPERGERLQALIDGAKTLPALRVAVVHPVGAVSLEGALAAREDGTIEPVLVGPRAKIEAAAEAVGLSLDGIEIIDVPHSHAAGDTAARLAGEHQVDAIMKGALHTDEVLTPVLNRNYGLRTERRLSHVFVMDAPSYHKLLLITDAAVNIAPNLDQKADILRNAVTLAQALGIETPKAAILSAVETVTGAIASTVDAASLCKMAGRGQISGVIADGPLAFDNAISPEAARVKGLRSEVAGDPDILLVPDLEAGNIMAKELDYLGGAVAAGIVLGAAVPIILTSRAEGRLPRRASCALASYLRAATKR
ncbi:bifunctional enoyl-CoA hydratase/phosphate acetyltransferase [Parvularcula lutaonensis]|uniref:Bifunctional enoyl-CoA hydratase/phosphate acetyltransferase n=1 Tax=Parvularcula lutaonensis TaxID=491923 RepID=A0ABV7MDQ3_9PROT|nr:bifunctional enoyl-CoA hydratase/phosphate acetyltransferase [Parvularcula lutaonensis]GGY52977.1 bifunctional enoyl-CoA hydratase/phosphate acetyltransferase [Parvularcula lutaonensis]